LKRAIQREVQDPLALRILSGDFSEGDTIEIDLIGGVLSFGKG
jgi:ATP-dependent Clp protease ATP-binding subunit ClpB